MPPAETLFRLAEASALPSDRNTPKGQAIFDEQMKKVQRIIDECCWKVCKRSKQLFIFSACRDHGVVSLASLEYALAKAGLIADPMIIVNTTHSPQPEDENGDTHRISNEYDLGNW